MNVRPRTRGWALSAVLAASLVVSACSSSEDGSNQEPIDRDIPELVVASGAPLASLDVTKALNSFTVGALAYELLEYSRPDGSFVPGLAESVAASPEAIVYDVRVAEFSDGSPVTTEDVEFTLERALAAPVTAPLLSAVKSVDVTGDRQVTVTLSRPDATVRGALSVVSGVVKEDYVSSRQKEFGAGEVFGPSSGPYLALSLNASGIEFERNPNYWGESPKPENVTFQFVSDPSTTQLALRSGEIDAAILLDPGTARQFESIEEASIYTEAGAILSFLSFDVTRPPFDDIHVRRAIAHAVDRESLIAAAFSGYADPLQSLVSDNQLTAISDQDAATSVLAELEQYPFDMDRAREEMAMSGHSDGFEVSVPTAPVVGFGEPTLLVLQENLKELGIELRIDAMSTEQWLAQLYAHEDLGMQLAFLTPAVSDPAGVLGLMVGEANAKPNGFNVANYTTPEVESALSTLLQEPSGERRLDATREILNALAEDLPYVPLATPQFVLVTGEGNVYAPEDESVSDITSALWIRGIRAAE